MCVHVGWWGVVYAAMRAAELAEVWCGYRGRASWRLQWVLIMAVHIDYGRAHVVTPPQEWSPP